MMSPDGSARAASGHNRIPIANRRNPRKARTRIRRELNDILDPGALTSRLKRYAAEPAPDGANLTSIHERTANGTEKAGHQLLCQARKFAPPRGIRSGAIRVRGLLAHGSGKQALQALPKEQLTGSKRKDGASRFSAFAQSGAI